MVIELYDIQDSPVVSMYFLNATRIFELFAEYQPSLSHCYNTGRHRGVWMFYSVWDRNDDRIHCDLGCQFYVSRGIVVSEPEAYGLSPFRLMPI